MGHGRHGRPRHGPGSFWLVTLLVGLGAVGAVMAQRVDAGSLLAERAKRTSRTAAAALAPTQAPGALVPPSRVDRGTVLRDSPPRDLFASVSRVSVPWAASGTLTVVPGGDLAPKRVPKRGKVVRYVLAIEKGLTFDPATYAETIRQVFDDPRGWAHNGARSFQRVSSGPIDFTIVLASPALTDRICLASGNATDGKVSCFARRSNQVMLNAMRWGQGAPSYQDDIASYRVYLINHEVGHRLGRHHVSCPGLHRLAPVMMQQTKGVGACRSNPWPYP